MRAFAPLAARRGGVVGATLVALVVLTSVLSWPQTNHAQAAGPPNPDLSMAVLTAGCSTDAEPPEDKCAVATGSTFMVQVSLNSFDGLPDVDGDTKAAYTGVQVRLNYSAGLTQSKIRYPWPDCGVNATSTGSGTVLTACITGVGANESEFVGPVIEFDFTCSSDETTQTIEMVHGAPLDSNVIAEDHGSVVDKDPAEVLTVNCTSLAPTPTPAPTATPPPKPVPAASIAAGRFHSCASTVTGAVKCWGLTYGITPIEVAGLENGVLSVEAGADHTCAPTVSGGVKCFGTNGFGQLGDGTITNRSQAVDVVGLTSGITAVTAGIAHSCALTVSGGVKCWGTNSSGQLGAATTDTCSGSPCSRVSVDVTGFASGASAVAAGGSTTCAVTVDGGVKCWGGDFGSAPVDVAGLESGIADVDVGLFHVCAVTIAGGVICVGFNKAGQLGDGSLTTGVVGVSAGSLHTCAVMMSGAVKCWGSNADGQLGDGTTVGRSTPADVVGLTGAVAVSAGDSHTCALTAAGNVKCWGANNFGQLGTTTTQTCDVACEKEPASVTGFGPNPVGGLSVDLDAQLSAPLKRAHPPSAPIRVVAGLVALAIAVALATSGVVWCVQRRGRG